MYDKGIENHGHSGVSNEKIVTVRPESQVWTKQQLPNFVGISGTSAGSTGICMNIVIIPPGGAADPHYHLNYETAIYILKGKVKTKYGPNLENVTINQEGDFLFIPANVPHQPINLSETEEMRAIVARNDPNEQESVMSYHPEEEKTGE